WIASTGSRRLRGESGGRSCGWSSSSWPSPSPGRSTKPSPRGAPSGPIPRPARWSASGATACTSTARAGNVFSLSGIYVGGRRAARAR
ncbi:MAG: hypothetical protein AVDCRST_MAG05-2581, partial [uncultured Rubrobacteraceae bacterium]